MKCPLCEMPLYHSFPTFYLLTNQGGTIWYCIDCSLSFNDKKLQYFYKDVLYSQQEMERISKLKVFL